MYAWTPTDYAALVAASNQMGVPAGWLAAIMMSESHMNPGATNSIGCTGLIQFCGSKPPAGLSPAQQMPYVLAYFAPKTPPGGWISRGQLYQAGYVPATIATKGSSPNTIITRRGDGFYDGNEIFDPQGKGYITVGDLDAHLDAVTAASPTDWATVTAGIQAAGGSMGSADWKRLATAILGGLAIGGVAYYLYENRVYLLPAPRRRYARRYA